MRSLVTALGGLVAAGAVLAVGFALDGLLGAGLVMLGLVAATLVAGVALASIPIVRRLATSPLRAGLRTTRRRPRKPHRCDCCGGERVARGQTWVCGVCDLGPATLPGLI